MTKPPLWRECWKPEGTSSFAHELLDKTLLRKRKALEEGGEEKEVSEPSPQGHKAAPHGWKDGMMPTRSKSYH